MQTSEMHEQLDDQLLSIAESSKPSKHARYDNSLSKSCRRSRPRPAKSTALSETWQGAPAGSPGLADGEEHAARRLFIEAPGCRSDDDLKDSLKDMCTRRIGLRPPKLTARNTRSGSSRLTKREGRTQPLGSGKKKKKKEKNLVRVYTNGSAKAPAYSNHRGRKRGPASDKVFDDTSLRLGGFRSSMGPPSHTPSSRSQIFKQRSIDIAEANRAHSSRVSQGSTPTTPTPHTPSTPHWDMDSDSVSTLSPRLLSIADGYGSPVPLQKRSQPPSSSGRRVRPVRRIAGSEAKRNSRTSSRGSCGSSGSRSGRSSLSDSLESEPWKTPSRCVSPPVPEHTPLRAAATPIARRSPSPYLRPPRPSSKMTATPQSASFSMSQRDMLSPDPTGFSTSYSSDASRSTASTCPPTPMTRPRLSRSTSLGQHKMLSDTQDEDLDQNKLSFAAIEKKKVIGEGSFYRVFKVFLPTKKGTKEPFALKASKRPFRSNSDRALYLKEYNLVKRIPRNKHVVNYEYTWQEQFHIYIVMEYCRCNLARAMKIFVINEDFLWRVLSHISTGLEHIHDHGILHMDIKPVNILLGRDHVLKLADFGQAIGEQRENMIVDAAEGDSQYMAPELMRHNSIPTKAADIFSLGLLMVELVMNRARLGWQLPKEGPQWQNFRKGRKEVEQFLLGISRSLMNIILRMLNPNPPQRPSAKEIRMKCLAYERRQRGHASRR